MNNCPEEGLTATKPVFNGRVSPNLNPLDVTVAVVVLGFGRVSPNTNPLDVTAAAVVLGFGRVSPNLNALDVTAAVTALGLARASPNLNPLDVIPAAAVLDFGKVSSNVNPLDVTAAVVTLGLERTSTGKAGGAPLVVRGCAKAVVVARGGADVAAVVGDAVLAVGMLGDPNRNPPDDSAPNISGLCWVPASGPEDDGLASLVVTVVSERVGSGLVTTFVTAAEDISGGAIGVMVRPGGRVTGSVVADLWSWAPSDFSDTSITRVRGTLPGSGAVTTRDSGIPQVIPLVAGSVGMRGVEVVKDCSFLPGASNGLGVVIPSLVSPSTAGLGGVEALETTLGC